MMRDIGGAKWRSRDNLHLTLRFFGEVQEPVANDLDSELMQIADSAAPFEIALKGAGSFGGADPHALWLGATESPTLKKLAADCEKAAKRVGLKPEPHKFTPHVTLAYLSNAALDRVQAFQAHHALFETPSFRVERFGLYSSIVRHGAPSLYRLEVEYPLLGRGSRLG